MSDMKILAYFGFNPYHGDVGIEIELESNLDPFPNAPKGWRSEVDGSLKAEFSVEYVTNNELKFEDVPEAIDRVRKRISNIKLVEGVRSGVHVHINCQQLTVKETMLFAFTYLAMEIPLVKFCGDDREGNLFCLRAVDAEYLVDKIYYSLTKDNLNYLIHSGNSLRYSSLNFASLNKYGTLEFRAMKTYPELAKIEDWVEILRRIKSYGENLNKAVDIAYQISLESPENWMQNILGEELYKKVRYDGIEKDIMNGLRLIQPLLHAGI